MLSRLLTLTLLFTSYLVSGQTEINALRDAYNAAYNDGSYETALVKVDEIIAYWKSENQQDSVAYYRYKRAHTLGQNGESYKAAQEARYLIDELASAQPLPKFMGSLYFSYGKNILFQSQFVEATQALNKCIAFESQRALPDSANIASALEWKGIACIYTDTLDKAQILIEKALDLQYAINDSTATEIAYTLNSLAGVYYQRNLLFETNAAYEEAYRILKLNLAPDHPHTLSIASNLSNVKSAIGEISGALKLLESAIAGHEKQKSVYNLIYEYHNLASIYATSLHDAKRARVYFLRSLNLADSLLPQPDFHRASIYDGLGGTNLYEENYLKADSFFLLAYRERLQMNEESKSGLGQSSYNLGITSEGLGNSARAERYYTESLEYFRASFGQNHPKTANALFELADLDWMKGNHDKALHTYRQCLEIYTTSLTPHHAYPLQANIKLAMRFEEINLPDSVSRYIKKAWEGVCDTKGAPIRLDELSQYPIDFVDPEVLELIDLNLNLLIKKRNIIGNPGIQEGVEIMKLMDKLMVELWPMLNFENETTPLLQLIKSIYRKGVLFAATENTDNDAVKTLYLNSIEQSQSASIRSALQNRKAMHYANVPDSIIEKDRRLREKLYFAQSSSRTEQTEYQDKLNFSALNEWRDFQNELIRQYPEWYSARYAPTIPELAEVQKKLTESDASLVTYFAADTSLVILLADGDNFQIFSSSIPIAWKDSVRTYRSLIENRASPKRLANLSNYLYTLFWQPIEGKVKKKVMLIPDGALNFLNFEALISDLPETDAYADWDWLLKKHVFLYRNALPGKEKPIRIVKKEFLALVPGFSDELKTEYHNQLETIQLSDSTFTHWVQTPWSVKFAEELRSAGKVFIGIYATKSAFKENAATAEILHFGTHAVLDDTKPLSSYLALTPEPAKQDDGYLYAYELYNQPLNAQLAILTACETGIGTYREGEGVISLAHAFRYAGCPNVVYSLWKIDDKQSTWLIKEFYNHLDDNQHFSDALHLAKLDYLAQHTGELNAPYYWAGIVLTGSDGKLSSKNGILHKYGWIIVSGTCVLLFVMFQFRKKKNKKDQVNKII